MIEKLIQVNLLIIKNKNDTYVLVFDHFSLSMGLDVMITETNDGQIFGFIGNDIYNLIRINDDRLKGNTKSLPNEEFKKLNFLKFISLKEDKTDIFQKENKKYKINLLNLLF